jgi:hypothetical protein
MAHTLVRAEKRRTDPDEGVCSVPKESKGRIEAYKKDMKMELRVFDKKIAALGKKVKKAGSTVEAEARGSWIDLKTKQKAAKSKLTALTAAAWEKTKGEAEAARDELKKAYEKATSYFK